MIEEAIAEEGSMMVAMGVVEVMAAMEEVVALETMEEEVEMMVPVEVDGMVVSGEVVLEVDEMAEGVVSTPIAVWSGKDASIKRKRTKKVQLRLRIRFLMK